MYAFVGDVITYYLDNQARESRISTATQRRNVIALARLLGYRLHGAQAATAEAVFSLARPPVADVPVATGTVVRTREVTEPVRFQLLSGLVIPAGLDPPRVVGVVEHSELHTQLFDAQGLAGLDVPLDHVPYLDASAEVSAARSLRSLGTRCDRLAVALAEVPVECLDPCLKRMSYARLRLRLNSGGLRQNAKVSLLPTQGEGVTIQVQTDSIQKSLQRLYVRL